MEKLASEAFKRGDIELSALCICRAAYNLENFPRRVDFVADTDFLVTAYTFLLDKNDRSTMAFLYCVRSVYHVVFLNPEYGRYAFL